MKKGIHGLKECMDRLPDQFKNVASYPATVMRKYTTFGPYPGQNVPPCA